MVMLKCSLVPVGSPLSQSCSRSGPLSLVPSLVFLQPQLLGCAGGSPAEKMEFCPFFMILEEGICCSLIIPLPYSDTLVCFLE